MRINNFIKNQFGLTLAEVLIMIGVSSVFILGLAELTKSITVANRTQRINSTVAQLQNEINTILNDPALCAAALGGQNPVGNIDFAPPMSRSNLAYRELTVGQITSAGGGGNYTLTVPYQKPVNTLGVSVNTQLTFSYTATLTAGNIATCQGSSDQQACNQLGGVWGNPVVNVCNFNNIDAATCTSLGGTYLPPCTLSLANKNTCEALKGTWNSSTLKCDMNLLQQDGKKFCQQMGGAWIIDADANGGFRCDFTNTFSGDCSTAGANLVPDGSGSCRFQPATADACFAIGGVWLMRPYPHCELNLNPGPECNNLGCTWDNVQKRCECTPTSPPPTQLPVVSVAPPGSCNWFRIAKHDALKNKYMYALELFLKGEEANACVEVGPGCDETGDPVASDCNQATEGSTYSKRSFNFCLQNCGPVTARYECQCTASTCAKSFTAICNVGNTCVTGAWNQYKAWVVAELGIAGIATPATLDSVLADLYNSVALSASQSGAGTPRTGYITAGSLGIKGTFRWMGMGSNQYTITATGGIYGTQGSYTCPVANKWQCAISFDPPPSNQCYDSTLNPNTPLPLPCTIGQAGTCADGTDTFRCNCVP